MSELKSFRVIQGDTGGCERAERELCRQKYKRCLAMASYWVAVSYQCVDDKHRHIAEKRHYKWLKLAKNFEKLIIGVDKAYDNM